MIFKKFTIAMLVAVFFGLSFGCSNELTNKELQERLLAANSNLDTYNFDMNTVVDLIAENLGQKRNIKTETIYTGSVDRGNKFMSMNRIVKMDQSGLKMELDFETYIVDNFVYIKTLGKWMRLKLDYDIWTQYDNIQHYVEIIQSGTIERLEDESFDGNSYYIIKINPDLKRVVESALNLQEQSNLNSEDMDFEDMVKEYSATIWVNKKTLIMEKIITKTKLLMTIENVGKENAESIKGEVDMSIITELKIMDINKDIAITLPEEAKDATVINELGNLQLDKDKRPVSITGNAIAEVFRKN